MSDPRIGKARGILRELASDPEAQRLIREREEAQMLYRMELEAAETRGEARGKAQAVIEVMSARGIHPPTNSARPSSAATRSA